jgi:hypothetical protein
VSNELGAGNPRSAAFSVVVVTVLSFVLSVIISVVILLCRDHISYIFTEGEEVSRAVSQLTPLLAVTLILNGIQPVLSGQYVCSSTASRSITFYIFTSHGIENKVVDGENVLDGLQGWPWGADGKRSSRMSTSAATTSSASPSGAS